MGTTLTENKCNCAYCRSGILADFIKRWQERHKKKREGENGKSI